MISPSIPDSRSAGAHQGRPRGDYLTALNRRRRLTSAELYLDSAVGRAWAGARAVNITSSFGHSGSIHYGAGANAAVADHHFRRSLAPTLPTSPTLPGPRLLTSSAWAAGKRVGRRPVTQRSACAGDTRNQNEVRYMTHLVNFTWQG